MTHMERNKLLIVLSLLGAALASMGACFAVFVASKDEHMSVAAAAFAVAGLISMMPWQLAQACQAANRKGRATYDALIKSGARMALASLLFVSGAMLRYYRFHADEIAALGKAFGDISWALSTLFSAVAFLIASLYFMMGVMQFAWVLVEMTHEKGGIFDKLTTLNDINTCSTPQMLPPAISQEPEAADA